MKERSNLYPYLIKHRLRYIKGFFFLIIINLLQIMVPKITGNIVDGLETMTMDEGQLLYYAGILMIISLMAFLSHYLSRVQVMGASNLFDYEVRNEMFSHLLSLSARFFHNNRIGDIMALATNDLGSLRMILSRGFNLITNTIILLVGSIIIMARHMDPRLTLYAILPFPILIFVMLRFGPMINKRFRRVQESFSDLTQKTQENISGIRVVKAFGQEGYEKENFDAINRDNFDINMALVRVQGVFYPLINLIASFSFLIAFVYGGNLIIDGKMTLGEFIAFNGYLGIIIRPITSIGMIVNFIQRAKASAQRIDELLDEEPDITDSGKSLEVQNSWKDGLKGRIEFRDLSFSYKKGSPMVLKNIDLNLEPGKTLGIIGKVGSGKSTIANLILRLYDPLSEDTLLIDGTDIREIPLKTLRQNIGYIPQDNFLFSASITENIGFNPEKPAMEEIRRAAQVSQVDEDIMGFKEGYETLLGERGVNLSGGQRQRVSIARALVKDPSILIMDDCLSAVDTNTEREILRELKTYTKDRTTIIIGHRISGIQHADEIIVLDEGRIIERGTHEELLAIKGYYNRIYLRQLLEEEIESA